VMENLQTLILWAKKRTDKRRAKHQAGEREERRKRTGSVADRDRLRHKQTRKDT